MLFPQLILTLMTVQGVEFTITILSSTPQLVSQLTFVASPELDDAVILCSGSGETDTRHIVVENELQLKACKLTLYGYKVLHITIRVCGM